MKWLIIGMFGFAALWGAYYFLKYLLDPSIKTLDEVKQMGIPIIGYLGKENENPTIIDRLEKKNGSYDTIDYIISTIGLFEENPILLCVNMEDKDQKYIAEEVSKRVKNVEAGNWIQTSTSALEAAINAKCIILGIKFKETSWKQLKRELEVCKIHKIRISGFILVN